jgi:FkbM family methyltransferase
MSEQFIIDKLNNLQYNAGIALDIGANIGSYSHFLSTKFSKVYAFEPHPDNVRRIRNLNIKNIVVMEMAISNETGVCKLFTQPDNLITGHSINHDIIAHPNWQLDENRYMEVPCMTIDDFCKGKDISFIKCDIEGGEDFIWETAKETLKNNKLSIALEIHYGVDVDRLFSIFENLGYTIEFSPGEVITHDTVIFPSMHVWISQ